LHKAPFGQADRRWLGSALTSSSAETDQRIA